MFRALDLYKSLCGINSTFDAIQHLICAKPVLNALVYSEFPDEWYAFTPAEVRKESESLDFLTQHAVLGYLAEHMDLSGDKYHSWLHAPKIGFERREVLQTRFYKTLYDRVELPYGFYTGKEVSDYYPEIIAVNLFSWLYGNPILRLLQALTKEIEDDYHEITETTDIPIGDDYESHNRQRVLKIIKRNIIENHIFSKEGIYEDILDIDFTEYKAFLFWDEPKLYGKDGERYFDRFLKAYTTLEEADEGMLEVSLREGFICLRENIHEIKAIKDYDTALTQYQSFELKLPFFPIFAWDFATKANDTLDRRFEIEHNAIYDRIDSAENASLEKRIIEKELELSLQNGIQVNVSFLAIDKDFLRSEGNKQAGYSSYYPFSELYEALLERSVLKHYLAKESSESNQDQVPVLDNKTLSDLALLAKLMEAGGYFKTQAQAIDYVSRSFKVKNKKGTEEYYSPYSIRQSLNQLSQTERKKKWVSLRGRINDFFANEK